MFWPVIAIYKKETKKVDEKLNKWNFVTQIYRTVFITNNKAPISL